jgi:hypothetical protein
VGVCIGRGERVRLAEVLEPGLMQALGREHDAEVVVGLDKIGFDGNGLTVGGDGIRAMSPIVQRAAQVVVRLGTSGLPHA